VSEFDDNTPIDPQSFLYGVKVVSIGDARVKRGLTRHSYTQCKHADLTYDEAQRRVFCNSCQSTISGFSAFLMLVERFDSAWKEIERRMEAAKAAETANLRRIVSKRLDEEWQKKDTVPCCPHCKEGLFPEDFMKANLASKALTIQKRKAKAPA
jgi:hypothetical protein